MLLHYLCSYILPSYAFIMHPSILSLAYFQVVALEENHPLRYDFQE